MKYKSGENLMNVPNYITFGCEIEIQNVDKQKLKEMLQRFPELKDWKVSVDESVPDNGVEIVSPPLNEIKDPNVYNNFNKVLELVKLCPFDKNRKVYVNEDCGGHIHLDATKMRNNPEMMESFLRLWAESEEIIYKICNGVGDPIRKSAVKMSPVNGVKRILFSGYSEVLKAIDRSNIEQKNVSPEILKALAGTPKKILQGVELTIIGVVSKDGFAHPIGKKLQKQGKKGDFIQKVIYSSKGNKFKFNKSLKQLACHETGINTQHIATNREIQSKLNRLTKGKEPNTYEFRIHNSSLDLETWKQNIYLDSAISKIAYEMAYEPGKNDKKLSCFFEKEITEEEKVNRFLDLLFENSDDKKIYKERWQSVKDAPVFKKAKGFSRTFLKGNAKNTKVKDILNTMKGVFHQAKEVLKDENSSVKLDAMVMDYGGRE